MKTKRICFISIAVLLVALSVLLPISISELAPNQYVFRIGNIATAHDPDATCDGTDDHVQFQQILDALPADVGGSIEVEAGYYTFGTGETVSRNISNVSIVGVGGLVSFDGDDTTAIFTAGGNNWRFENIVTDDGGIDVGATSGYLIRNVLIGSTYYAFVTDNIDIEDHSARHESGGADAIKLDDLATPDDNTDLDATTGYHGLLPKLAGNTSLYLRSDGTWQEVSGGGTGDMLKSVYDSNDDGLIDNDAGGTAWDSSAVTGVAYVTSGTWSGRPTGIADTNILVVSGTVNSGEHCRFTGTGIEGLTSAELLADLSGDAGAAFDWNAQNLINVGTVDGRDVSVDGTKLDGIEAGADVTDATNVDAAGAVMESDYGATTFLYATLDNTPETKTPAEVLAILSGEATAAFDWNAQNLINVGTVDGRDVSVDGTKLDGIEAGADVTDATNVDAAGAVMESDYDADTFMYAATDDTPAATAPANVLAALSGHAGATFDWNGQQLENWQIENGATAPVSPATYQLFIHTPTGRKVLLVYDGSNWIPLDNLGTITMYVDNTDGTDSIDYGTGVDSDAFQSIQYAVDQIPANYNGDVIININDEDYDETVTISGKKPTGDYTITLQGTLSEQKAATADSKVQGTGGTQGSITDTGEFGSYDNMLIYITNDDEYRIIDSDDSDTATIVGVFSDAVDLAYKVYDWGTSINGINIVNGQKGILIYDIEVDNDGLKVTLASGVDAYRVKLSNSGGYNGLVSEVAILTMDTSYVVGDTYVFEVYRFGFVSLSHSKVYTTSNGDRCARLHDTGQLQLSYGCILDASSTTNTYGIEVKAGCVVNTAATAAQGYNRIRNQGTGIDATSGGTVFNTANNQYSGNTVDENADAGSYSYID